MKRYNRHNHTLLLAVLLASLVGVVLLYNSSAQDAVLTASDASPLRPQYPVAMPSVGSAPASSSATMSTMAQMPTLIRRSSGAHGSHAAASPYTYGASASAMGSLYTSSSRTLQSYGGGTSQQASGGASSVNASSISYGYSAPVAAMPIRTRSIAYSALATTPGTDMSDLSGELAVNATKRRVQVWDDENETWVEDGTSKEGDEQTIGGVTYVFHNGVWIVKADLPEVGTPIGALPAVFMLLLIAAYAVGKTWFRKNQIAQ